MTNRYTHGHSESVLRSHRWRTAENSAAHLLPHLSPGQRLLDIGAGPGTLTADLAARTAPGRATALEATPEALDLTRAELERRGVAAELVVGDVHDLALPDDSYDIVHAHQVLQHVADPVGALREMRRVCRPGGLVAARDSDYHGFVWHPADEGLDAWMDLYQRLARANGGEPDAGRRLLSWAQAAGFAEITASASVWCFTTAEDRAFWGGMWADRVRSSAFAEQALATGLATEDDLDRMADAWLAWAAEPGGWFTVLHGEILARA